VILRHVPALPGCCMWLMHPLPCMQLRHAMQHNSQSEALHAALLRCLRRSSSAWCDNTLRPVYPHRMPERGSRAFLSLPRRSSPAWCSTLYCWPDVIGCLSVAALPSFPSPADVPLPGATTPFDLFTLTGWGSARLPCFPLPSLQIIPCLVQHRKQLSPGCRREAVRVDITRVSHALIASRIAWYWVCCL
jgi:hypothetical protein